MNKSGNKINEWGKKGGTIFHATKMKMSHWWKLNAKCKTFHPLNMEHGTCLATNCGNKKIFRSQPYQWNRSHKMQIIPLQINFVKLQSCPLHWPCSNFVRFADHWKSGCFLIFFGRSSVSEFIVFSVAWGLHCQLVVHDLIDS